MQLGKSIVGKEVISVQDGRKLGTVDDLYLGADLERVAALYLGSEGFLNRTACLIPVEHVVLAGEDVILVDEAAAVQAADQLPEVGLWTRRKSLHGRPVTTTGGTRIGTLGDVILNEALDVVGYSLAKVEVKGPLAEKQAIARSTVTDLGLGKEGQPLTVDLARAEQQALSRPAG